MFQVIEYLDAVLALLVTIAVAAMFVNLYRLKKAGAPVGAIAMMVREDVIKQTLSFNLASLLNWAGGIAALYWLAGNGQYLFVTVNGVMCLVMWTIAYMAPKWAAHEVAA